MAEPSKKDELVNNLKNAAGKGRAFFKKAADAIKGDEAAQQDLANTAANAIVKTAETAERIEGIAKDSLKKAEQKWNNRKP